VLVSGRIVGFTVLMTGRRDVDSSTVLRSREGFLSSGDRPSSVRSVIVDSWVRSVAAGVDADHSSPPITLERDALGGYRSDHPLSRVFPLLYDVLGRAAEDCDSLMAVADAHGQLLWVCGQPGVLRRAERINFVEGARWDEGNAGTNAPGTALRLDAPVLIRGGEHFARMVQPWSCAAAPIHDPLTQDILGIIDITGGPEVATVQTVAMVRAAARMAESELGRLAALAGVGVGVGRRPTGSAGGGRSEHRTATLLRLEGLGRLDCVATVADRAVRLTPRHSEIAAILSLHPNGLTGDQLALEIYPEEVTGSTLRAELVRMRGLLGDDVLASRPYRFACEVESDWAAVAAQLAVGDVAEALRIYRGPLLPQSDAPGVRSFRDQLQRQLRAAVIASGRPELMVSWTRSRWGSDDLRMWQRQLAVLPVDSPLRPLARAEVAKLDEELGR
jgi:hypothetical protein